MRACDCTLIDPLVGQSAMSMSSIIHCTRWARLLPRCSLGRVARAVQVRSFTNDNYVEDTGDVVFYHKAAKKVE